MLATDKFDRAHLVVSYGHPVVNADCESERTARAASISSAVPAMADAAVLLQVLLSSSAVNLNSITEVIRGDVGLTIELLRLASPDVDDPAESVSISDAVVHAGIGGLRFLASQVELVSASMPPSSLRKCEQFWSHARLTALMAEEQAYKVECDAEEAYIAGLLFRIGELPALLGWNWGFTSVGSREIAGVLARMWNLPPRLAEILDGDDLQLASSSRTLLQLVRVADQQAWRVQGLLSKYARKVF
ncbi:MAG TPA: HDOD domain-containing protein [Terriglobales bacterium]|nr:HDOD domain-containing protein [Terriglobales bacterium]